MQNSELKNFPFTFFCLILIITVSFSGFSQSKISADITIDWQNNALEINQQIWYKNQSNSEINHLILNDWNNAFSTNDSPLAKRFSDEFQRQYFLADKKDKGRTLIQNLTSDSQIIDYQRLKNQPDLIDVRFEKPISPGDSIQLSLEYRLELPHSKFTRYGHDDQGNFLLKEWIIVPALYNGSEFVKYSNENLNDWAVSLMDLDLTIHAKAEVKMVSDLDVQHEGYTYHLTGKNRQDFSLFIGKTDPYNRFSFNNYIIESSLSSRRVTDIQKAIIVEKIISFTQEFTGLPVFSKIMISDEDYLKNPVYGLNQLPAFLAPFPDSFLYELKFLKTFLSNYLSQQLQLDPRKDNWIFDAYQVYIMMEYMDRYYPNNKMMGRISQLGILKSFHLVQLPFNDQYRYYYMMMARRNLDQALNLPKDELIKFNQQIASKYRAGLSLIYLDKNLNNNIVKNSLTDFYNYAKLNKSDAQTFRETFEKQTSENLDWFFNTVIGSRKIIDYSFKKVEKSGDSLRISIRNRTQTAVPFPLYVLKKNEVLASHWIPGITSDTTFTIARENADRLIINYKNEVPEFNMRNNVHSLKSFKISNRPFKFNFMKDLENPFYNQIMYVPNFEYNLYDGITLGLRLHNKTLLEKPFVFDVSPGIGLKSKAFVGSASFAVNQYFRESNWFNARYSISGNYFHYAPDAIYYKINPMVIFRKRPSDFRDNKKQQFLARHVIVHREKTEYVLDETDDNQNYSVFNLRFSQSDMEATHTFNYKTDLQLASNFGKVFFETEYRKLFESNRQINLRFYAGTFLYNSTQDDYFSFALDRPTDYLFDYNYYGRSESSGLFSQQLIMSEGGFKSKLSTAFANRWMMTTNASVNIWNWIEVYGDLGLIKSKGYDPKFVYDSGIRLNLVTDYFELYFPVYSNLGWEIAEPNYAERIRFIVTIDPKTLVGLFTRKWL